MSQGGMSGPSYPLFSRASPMPHRGGQRDPTALTPCRFPPSLAPTTRSGVGWPPPQVPGQSWCWIPAAPPRAVKWTWGKRMLRCRWYSTLRVTSWLPTMAGARL